MRLEHVCAAESGETFLGPLSLDGPENVPWLFLGPSGSGKTTMLQLISGVRSPSQGKLVGFPDRGQVAYMPQFPDRVLAGRSLASLLCPHPRPDLNQRKAARRVLAQAGLGHLSLAHPPGALSAGEKRRLSLVLLDQSGYAHSCLDEPDAGLDHQNLLWLEQWLKQRTALGGRVWLSSHRISPFVFLNPWLVILNKGQVIGSGTIKELARIEDLPGFMSHPAARVKNRIWPKGPVLAQNVEETLRKSSPRLAQVKVLLEDSEFVV